MLISHWSIAAFFVIFLGHTLSSSILQYIYYFSWSRCPSHWKIQSKNVSSLSEAHKWWLPAWNSKSNRPALHAIFASLNLVVASLFASFVSEASIRKWNKMSFSNISDYGWQRFLFDLLMATIFENIVEYYWHRMMHVPYFYKLFHKYHHYYKSPEPWDDMFIHPIEAFGYYCILYSPPFLFQCHIYAFVVYMMIMGICGILDHSGIHFSFPLVYNSKDHDAHHQFYDINYAFPFPYMDMLHGTYRESNKLKM